MGGTAKKFWAETNLVIIPFWEVENGNFGFLLQFSIVALAVFVKKVPLARFASSRLTPLSVAFGDRERR